MPKYTIHKITEMQLHDSTSILSLNKLHTKNQDDSYFLFGSNDAGLKMVIDVINDRWFESKKWVAKLNYDNSIETLDTVKKQGKFFNYLLLLIERLNTFENFERWVVSIWDECCFDLMQMEIIEAYEGIEHINKSWKKAKIQLMRNDLNELKNNQNPFKSKKVSNQILDKIIDLALFYKSQSEVFHANYWLPFLRAYSAFISDFDRNPYIKRAFIEKDQYVVQVGKGNSPRNRKKFPISRNNFVRIYENLPITLAE